MKSVAYAFYYNLEVEGCKLKEIKELAKKFMLSRIGTKSQIINRIKRKLETKEVCVKHLALIVLNETIEEIYNTSKDKEEFSNKLNRIDERLLKDSYLPIWTNKEYSKGEALRVALERLSQYKVICLK